MSARWAPALMTIFAFAALGLAGCTSREAARERHMTNADRFVREGRYREAILEYKNAIKRDARFGDARLKLAQAYARTGDVRESAAEYVRAAELLPGDLDAQLKAAAILLSARQFDRAMKHAETALTLQPRNIDAQIIAANALAGLKDLEGAIREIEEAIQLAPDVSRAYTSLGALRVTQGQREKAQAAFERAVALEPSSVNARLALAYFYWTVGDAGRAEEQLLATIQVSPSHRIGNRLLALFYATRGRIAEAEAPLQRLAAGNDTAATLALADHYVRSNRPDDARPLYEQLLHDASLRTRAGLRLCQLEYAGGLTGEAKNRLNRLLAQDPHDVGLLTLRSRWLLDVRQYDASVESAKAAVESDPASPLANYTLGLAYAGRGDTEQAESAFAETLRLNPRAALAELQLSRLFLARGEAELALRHAEAARKAQPRNLEARLGLTAALIKKADLRRADDELKSLKADFPRIAAVHAMDGHLRAARADTVGAMEAFATALRLDGKEISALSGMIAVQLRTKGAGDARETLRRALEKRPDVPELLLLAARFEQASGNAEAAERYLRRTIEADPAAFDAYMMLGRLFIRQNRLDDARAEFEALSRRRPDHVAASTMVGILYDMENRRNESRSVYESILARSPQSAVAANNLAWNYAERQQQLDVALQLAQTARQHLHTTPQVAHTLGWIYYLKNMPELAMATLEEAVTALPRNAVYNFHLGLAYARAGHTEKARQSLTRALQLDPAFHGADDARRTLASLQG